MIPVTWYLILQLFGDNNFSIQLAGEIPVGCEQFTDPVIVMSDDSISLVQKNYLERVRFGTNKRSVELVTKDVRFFECIDQPTSQLIMVSQEGIWGSYELTRDGVDLLLTELDILLLQRSYGKGTKR